jgi:hypothetical protein
LSVRFELSPSPLLAIALLAAHAAAALAVYLSMPGWAGALLATAFVALGAAAAWARALLRSPASVRAIELGAAEPVFHLASGESLAAPVGERRYVTRYVVALPFRNRTLLVTRDMLGAREFRRLRLWALWNRLPSDRQGVAAKQLAA